MRNRASPTSRARPATARPAILSLVFACIASRAWLSRLDIAAAAVMPDLLGRPGAIPDRPQRVVPLAPGITETTFALGRGASLVGVTDVCDYPPPAWELPRVGGIAAPTGLPVGVITSFCGAPLFIYLLRHPRGAEAW